jgi:hypothetical protein
MFNKLLFFVLLLSTTFLTASAQYNWALKSDKDGIKIYTSPVANSKLKALRDRVQLSIYTNTDGGCTA